MKSNSRNTHRLSQHPLEASFLKTWEDDPQFDLTLDYLLSDRANECGPVSARDREVAATVIQWLGSPVGQRFLEDATGVEIRNQIPEHLQFRPDGNATVVDSRDLVDQALDAIEAEELKRS